MTKRRLLILFIALATIGAYLLLQKKGVPLSVEKNPTVLPKSPESFTAHKIDSEKLSIDGKKVVGLPAGKEKEEIKHIKLVNSPSPQWQENLIDTLKLQGGSGIKDIAIKKVESFILNQDGKGLFVESASVTLINQKDEKTTFNVLVDGQSGKILQNWGQPVVDPANPRESFRIKMDPRYHNE